MAEYIQEWCENKIHPNKEKTNTEEPNPLHCQNSQRYCFMMFVVVVLHHACRVKKYWVRVQIKPGSMTWSFSKHWRALITTMLLCNWQFVGRSIIRVTALCVNVGSTTVQRAGYCMAKRYEWNHCNTLFSFFKASSSLQLPHYYSWETLCFMR